MIVNTRDSIRGFWCFFPHLARFYIGGQDFAECRRYGAMIIWEFHENYMLCPGVSRGFSS
ncbi:MAG: hypothetical protein DMG40_12165 [Acidobacteria bacterium]|nr:MAG: hypothetical protein DMG40_12165 [Acidobacteriota bacterium]